MIYTDKNKKIKDIFKYIICALGILGAAVILDEIIVKIINFAGVKPSDAAEKEINWGKYGILESLQLIIVNIISAIKNIKYYPVLIFDIVSVIGLAIGILQSDKKKNWMILVIFIAMFLSNFGISILQLDSVMYRTCASWGLFTAAIVMVAYRFLSEYKITQILAIIVISILVLQQTKTLNQLFYNDYMRYQKDLHIAYELIYDLEKDYDTSKPLVIMGTPYKGIGKYGAQSNSLSVLWWGKKAFNDNGREFIKFLNSLGYDFKVPTDEEYEKGKIEVVSFLKNDPDLDASDPRVIGYKGKNYLTTMSYLRLVSSTDGIHFKDEPEFPPIFGKGELEAFGIEDCRVATTEDGFYLTFTEVSSVAVGVGLIHTNDWKNYTRHGMIFPPHNKDCALFEQKIGDKYFALHRPSSPELGGNYIWLAESPDRLHWGNHKCVATTRDGMWDCARVGAGAAPIKTEEGWLEIYHGADFNHRYCLGALLLDLNDPSKVIARSEEPIMEPIAAYEQTGFFGNVVFTNGHLVDGDTITMYYGASDEVICKAELSISEILNVLKQTQKK